MLLDRFLPHYDVQARRSIEIAAEPQAVWDALRTADFAESWRIRWLFSLRGMAARSGTPRPLTLEALQRWRFAVLEQRAPDHLVLGLVGRFWRPTGHLLRIDPRRFEEPIPAGYARAAWSFELEPGASGGTHLVTETRVEASDESSRRSFLRYWRLVGPFSGLIRDEMLRLVARRATT